MSRKPLYRDTWGFGAAGNGYPGAFPRGLINKIRKKWWKQKRLWLFSGSHKDSDGVTIDIKPENRPDIVADCEQLPIKDECFTFVMADPPYSEPEAQKMYNLPYCNMLKVMNEAARVCAPGGNLILLHRMITFNHPEDNIHFKRMIIKAIVGVYRLGGWSNMRALGVWEKHRQLELTYPIPANNGNNNI